MIEAVASISSLDWSSLLIGEFMVEKSDVSEIFSLEIDSFSLTEIVGLYFDIFEIGGRITVAEKIGQLTAEIRELNRIYEATSKNNTAFDRSRFEQDVKSHKKALDMIVGKAIDMAADGLANGEWITIGCHHQRECYEVIPAYYWSRLKIDIESNSATKTGLLYSDIFGYLTEKIPHDHELKKLYEQACADGTPIDFSILDTASKSDERIKPPNSGKVGQPSSIDIYLAELQRRIDSGIALPVLRQEAKYLINWLEREHPDKPIPKLESMENAIRKPHNAYKKQRQSNSKKI